MGLRTCGVVSSRRAPGLSWTRARAWLVRPTSLLIILLLVSACSVGDGTGGNVVASHAKPFEKGESDGRVKGDQAGHFSAKVDHPLVPLADVSLSILAGTDHGSEIRVESRVLKRTDRVAGVPVAVVDVKEYKEGGLIEHTLDFYSEDERGNVWYMGERVDDYQDGQIVGHGGEWLAGQGDARPGLFMPASPRVGQGFQQERAPGVAEDRSTVVEVGLEVRTPAGSFSDCFRTRDVAPLDNATEYKLYCPGVGLVREQGVGERVDLVGYR
jgi:hypothetical protein